MRIVVVLLVALGAVYWFHIRPGSAPAQASSATPQAAAGDWYEYLPKGGLANTAAKVQLTSVRLRGLPETFLAQVGAPSLDGYIRRVERQALETLSAPRPSTVQVKFISGPRQLDVVLKSHGSIDRPLLELFHSRLMSMDRLRAKSSDVTFEIQLAVSP